MKTFQKIMIAAIVVGAFTFNAEAKESNAVKKAKEAVEAEPADWQTLAKSAKVCFRKGENTDQALKWIDESISLKKTAQNLEIKGDYYASVNNNEKALAYYAEAANVGRSNDPKFDSSKLQTKIWKMRS